MKYKSWLKNKNLSRNTLSVYLSNYKKWITYLDERKPTKTIVVKFITQYAKCHRPRSTRLMHATIISWLRFKKQYKLLEACRDIKLPSVQYSMRNIISLDEFKSIRDNLRIRGWYEQRDWLIFCTLLFTGMRVSELTKFNKRDIYDGNKFLIQGKGDKYRVIFINDYLKKLLSKWRANRICVSKDRDILTIKQINTIIKRVAQQYFNKYMTPHGLRRSFATNLLKSDINLEIVRRSMGHSNINTTSRYIQYTDDEIVVKLKTILD